MAKGKTGGKYGQTTAQTAATQATAQQAQVAAQPVLANAQTNAEVTQYAKDVLGIKIGTGLEAAATTDQLKTLVEQMELMKTEFPDIEVWKLSSRDPKKDKNMRSSMGIVSGYSNGREIMLNEAQIKAGNSMRGTLNHEMGHNLEKALGNKKYPNDALSQAVAWNTCEISRNICEAARKSIGMRGWKIAAKTVSNYATSNPSECLAECVKDYANHKQKAKPMSIAVWNELKKEFST